MKINFKGAFVYVALLVIQAASAFIVLPFFLNYLQPSDYGKYTLTISLAVLFQYFAGLSISDAVPTFFYHYIDDEKKARKYIQSILKFTLMVSVVIAILFSGIGNILFKYLFGTGFPFWDHGIYALCMGLLNSFSIPYQYYLRNNRMQKHFVILTVISTLSIVFFQVFVLTQTNFGVKGCYFAKIASSILVFTYVAIHSGFLNGIRIDFSFIRPSLRYSLVTLPVGLLKWASTYVDRFFIARYFSTEAVGVYGLLTSLVLMVQFFYLAVGQAFQPDIFYNYNKMNGTTNDYNSKVYDLIIVSTVIASICVLMCSLLIEIFSSHKEYFVIKYFLPLYLITILIEVYTYKLILLLTYHKRPRPLLYSSIVAVLLSAIFFFTLIPLLGIWGAILISIITNLSRLLICLNHARTFLPNIKFAEEIKPLLPGIIFFSLTLFFSFFNHAFYSQIVLVAGMITVGYYLISYKDILTQKMRALITYFKQNKNGAYES